MGISLIAIWSWYLAVGIDAKRRVIVHHLNSPCASGNSSSGRPCRDTQLHVTSSGLAAGHSLEPGGSLEPGSSLLEKSHHIGSDRAHHAGLDRIRESSRHTKHRKAHAGLDGIRESSRHTKHREMLQDAAKHHSNASLEEGIYKDLLRGPWWEDQEDALGGRTYLLVFFAVFGFCLCLLLCLSVDRVFRQQGGLSSSLSSLPNPLSSKASRRNQFVVRDRVMYEWEQTPQTLTFYTKPPSGVTRHNIEVTIWPCNIAIGRKLKPTFLNEELYAYIDVEKSYWNLSSTGELEVHLTKVDEEEWPCVFKSHQSSD